MGNEMGLPGGAGRNRQTEQEREQEAERRREECKACSQKSDADRRATPSRWAERRRSARE